MIITKSPSPLRFPGGKGRLAEFVERLLLLNDLKNCAYYEPFAGGCGLGLLLLENRIISRLFINDIDPAIYAFWWSTLNQPNEMIDKILTTPVSLNEWRKQKDIYSSKKSDKLSLGFATLFLNRTNHSGILNGGVIGGKSQAGKWLIGSRYNPEELVSKLRRLSELRQSIILTQTDALHIISHIPSCEKAFVYMDPPYYKPGAALYHSSYSESDHISLMLALRTLHAPWMLSYDDVEQVRNLYKGVAFRNIELLHTARTARRGRELMYFSSDLRIPKLGKQLSPSTSQSLGATNNR